MAEYGVQSEYAIRQMQLAELRQNGLLEIEPLEAPQNNLGFDDFLAELKREQSKRETVGAAEIRRRYGKLSDEEVSKIRSAQCLLKDCEKCAGGCSRLRHRYRKPIIAVENGRAEISFVDCPHAQNYVKYIAKRVRVPPNYIGKTFADYEVTPDNERAVRLAKKFCESKTGSGLFIFGQCGTGKTLLASIIAQQFIHDGKSLVFGDIVAIMDDIKRTYDNGDDTNALLDWYRDCNLLVLDDIGAGQITEWHVGILYRIINGRYNLGNPIIATSNLDLNGLAKRLTPYDKSRDKPDKICDEFVGKRITSRLAEMCTKIFLGLNDRRQ